MGASAELDRVADEVVGIVAVIDRATRRLAERQQRGRYAAPGGIKG